ncbi:MAG TPA: GNAT family N-acetyltransferase [Bdellovibrionota bacterium]|nr:GNAT family N-acetyltransferase [Bdellovibrionota bacterium]
MVHDLTTILAEERKVFAAFNVWRSISPRVTAFASPDTDEIPHWNMAYPHKLPERYTPDEMAEIESFFRTYSRKAHLLSTDVSWESEAVEVSEYFSSAGGRILSTPGIELLEFNTGSNELFGPFNEILAAGFRLDQRSAAYFKKQLAHLSERLQSRFWIARERSRFCAIASTFAVRPSVDFLFNVVVLPEYEGRGIATRLLADILRQTNQTIYVYSHNPAMRDQVLPKLGFRSEGVISVVPLMTYQARLRTTT